MNVIRGILDSVCPSVHKILVSVKGLVTFSDSFSFKLELIVHLLFSFQCGFFRRRRPQEQAFLISQNGDFEKPNGPPDARYKYM